jgi:putative hemolysin
VGFFAESWGRLLLLAGLLVGSFFFSASESALFALKRLDREELKRRGGAGSTAALALLADPRGLLASVLFGNLVVNMLIFSISTVLAFELAGAGHHGLAGVFGVAVLMTVIAFGEITPKLLALSFPMRMAPPLALVLQGFYGVSTPVRVLLVALMRRFEGRPPPLPRTWPPRSSPTWSSWPAARGPSPSTSAAWSRRPWTWPSSGSATS